MAIKIISLAALGIILTACSNEVLDAPPERDAPSVTSSEWTDLSKRDKPDAITDKPWHEIVIGVPDLEDVPVLFTDIGGFTERFRDETTLVLGAPGVKSGLIRFEKTAPDAVQTRPFGSRSWDTGCYFSVMMRAKDMPSIIDDAGKLGWSPLTDMAYLEFGPSKLNVVVLGHEKTGIQIQIYERLTTPLPEGFPEFERLSRPFNMMQMVRDRDAAYSFYQQTLGFDTFYYGKPYLSPEPENMPLGIPEELTTSVPYAAGITTPKSGLEWGRMEMIQVMMDGGQDLAQRCEPGNVGITEVRFNVERIKNVKTILKDRHVNNIVESEFSIRIKTPDGANVTFFEMAK